MSVLSRVKITQGETFSQHHIYVDGREIKNVHNVEINISPDTIPETVITLNSLPEFEGDSAVSYELVLETLGDACKVIKLACDIDRDIREGFEASINSALVLLARNNVQKEEQAKYILDWILGDN